MANCSKILERLPDGGSEVRGCFPPEHAQFGLHAAIYHGGLADIFELELTDWLFDLPRVQAYGYATEYGWVFTRSELLDGAAAAGLELVREFFLQETMDVVGAPEAPEPRCVSLQAELCGPHRPMRLRR